MDGRAGRTIGFLVAAGCVLGASAAPSNHDPSELIGIGARRQHHRRISRHEPGHHDNQMST